MLKISQKSEVVLEGTKAKKGENRGKQMASRVSETYIMSDKNKLLFIFRNVPRDIIFLKRLYANVAILLSLL